MEAFPHAIQLFTSILQSLNALSLQYVAGCGAALQSGGSLRFCSINARHDVCGSYPSLVVVPSSVTDEQLIGCAQVVSFLSIVIAAYSSCPPPVPSPQSFPCHCVASQW
jgi:hypothetical protein